MNLKLIKDDLRQPPVSPEEQELAAFCEAQNLELTMEWKDGQYWWHSDIPGERPIGIEIDRELERHAEYFRKSSLYRENLARAVGIKGSHRPLIWDLTAGLLGDTLLFLSFGCSVVALERHPVVAFLLRSALANAQHSALQRLTMEYCSAQEFLCHSEGQADIVYYDPMFEDANIKTLPRKEMRIFRNTVGNDADSMEVMRLAQARGPRRIVVKRPRHSRPIIAPVPLVFKGKSTRYDVYLAQNTRPFGSNPLE